MIIIAHLAAFTAIKSSSFTVMAFGGLLNNFWELHMK